MPLKQVSVRNFRCFAEAKLELDAELNWIVGQNASGKTSLLEALFFLGHGRSFRSSRPDRLVRQGTDGFELVARLRQESRDIVLGVGRDQEGTKVRLGGENVRSMAVVAQQFPVVALDSGMNQLISGGPGERRRWLDWGVFHVEQGFLDAWRNYQYALRQRNEALKADLPEKSLLPWTQMVATAGEKVSQQRRRHFDRLAPLVQDYVTRALPGVSLDADYRQGWAEQEQLLDALQRYLPKDREFGNTRRGPHRADVQFRVDGLPAEERLSRGQQKMLAGALWLAQVKVFSGSTAQRPLLLVDDLAAELDTENLARFLELLNDQSAQRVLTAIGNADIARTGLQGGKVFHVEHGIVSS